jgi:hypothetical protein
MKSIFTYSENSFDNLVERKQSFNGNVNIDKIEDSGTSSSTAFDIKMPISLFLSVKFYSLSSLVNQLMFRYKKQKNKPNNEESA